MNSTNKNPSVASTPTSAFASVSTRICVVFGSEEKENLNESDFRMGRVQVVDVDGNKCRGGAAVGESYTTFKQSLLKRFDERFDAQDKIIAEMRGENAQMRGENAQMRGEYSARFAHMGVRLDESAKLYNQQQDKINEQQGSINALRRRNEDLTIDFGLIDELTRLRNQRFIDEWSRSRDRALIDDLLIDRNWAMCPNCDHFQQQWRDTICLPCRHTFCAACCTERDLCPICLEDIEHRHTLL
jgi:hypothetical protein